MLITIRHNLATGRYHPFVWYEAPLPSDDGSGSVVRFRSKMNHTEGFADLATAREEVEKNIAPKLMAAYGCVVECRLDPVMPDRWESGQVPASIEFMRRIDRSAKGVACPLA